MSHVRFWEDIIGKRPDHLFRMVYVASKRAVPPSVRRRISERGLDEDFVMEMYTIAFELEAFEKARGSELDFEEKMRLSSKKLYRFLRENGFRRPKGSPGYVDDILTEDEAAEEHGLESELSGFERRTLGSRTVRRRLARPQL